MRRLARLDDEGWQSLTSVPRTARAMPAATDSHTIWLYHGGRSLLEGSYPDGLAAGGGPDDGVGFTSYRPTVEVGPDGSAWLTSDGVTHFDGTTVTPYLKGRDLGSLSVAPDGAVWVLGAEDSTEVHVITPEAVAATEGLAIE